MKDSGIINELKKKKFMRSSFFWINIKMIKNNVITCSQAIEKDFYNEVLYE